MFKRLSSGILCLGFFALGTWFAPSIPKAFAQYSNRNTSSRSTANSANSSGLQLVQRFSLPVPSAGQNNSQQFTNQMAVETWRDSQGNLIYICETGSISVVPPTPPPMSQSAMYMPGGY